MTEVPRPAGSTAGQADPLAGWDDTPLFMRKFDGSEENHTIAALQSLMFDDPPDEVAAGLKAKANALFAERKYRDALGFYTRAIDECGKSLPVHEQRVLWSNRAATNLELGNYGATLKDTSLVLSAPMPYPEQATLAFNKVTLKALLRSARALVALGKLPEALDALDRLRLLESELGDEATLANVGKSVREEVEGKLRAKEMKRLESLERTRRAKELEKRVGEALVMRGVSLPRRLPSQSIFHSCPSDITPPHFDPDAVPANSRPSLPLSPLSSTEPFVEWQPPPPSTALVFPVFVLNPLTTPPTRNLCLSFHTTSTFGDELRAMEQDPAEFNMYIVTKKGRVLKVGAKLELGKVLAAAGKDGDGWELKEGWALEMVAVPKGAAGETWVANWKAELAG